MQDDNESQVFKTVFFIYSCPWCVNSYRRPRDLIIHAGVKHQNKLLSRQIGYRRPRHPYYEYQVDPNRKFEVIAHACPSCWYFSFEEAPYIEHMNEHVRVNTLKGLEKERKEQNAKEPKILKMNKTGEGEGSGTDNAENKDAENKVNNIKVIEQQDLVKHQQFDESAAERIFIQIHDLTEMFKAFLVSL